MGRQTSQSRTVLITGCSSGIGLALVKEFQKKGYFTIASARKPEDVARLENIASAAVQLDVQSTESVSQARKKVESLLGENRGLDVLVNSAGQAFDGPSIDASIESIENAFAVNVFGPMRVTKEFTPLILRARGKGRDSPRIVQIGSVVALAPYPFGGVYCATKTALIDYSLGLQTEMELLGVNVIVVYAGRVETNILENAKAQKDHNDTEYLDTQLVQDVKQRVISLIPEGTPADSFARAVVSKVTRSNPPSEIYEGATAWICWLLSFFVSARMIEYAIAWKTGATAKAWKQT